MEFSEELLDKINTNHGISYTHETVNGDDVLCYDAAYEHVKAFVNPTTEVFKIVTTDVDGKETVQDERSFAGKDPETVLRDVAEAAGELDQSLEDAEISIADYPSTKD